MRLGRAEMRMRVYDSAANIAQNSGATDQARREAYSLLSWMARGDGADDSTKRAAQLATMCRENLSMDGLLQQ